MGEACMAAARAGVLQLSISGVLASVGCAGLARLSARGVVAESFVSRSPPPGRGAKVLNMGVGELMDA
eukprot:806158-Pleurochrysis_carterae.AAC.1